MNGFDGARLTVDSTSEGKPLNERTSIDVPPVLAAMPVSRMLDYGLASSDVAAFVEGGHAGQWVEVAEQTGERHMQAAAAHRQRGEANQAAQAWEWAAAAFNVGQAPLHSDSAVRLHLYSRATEALLAAMDDDGDIARIELVTDSGSPMFGWESIVPNALGNVVVLGGLSGWGMTFIALARALARRRVSAILAEGPGQGETRMRSGLRLSREALPLFKPFLARAAGQAGKIGLVGNSFGGLVAAHLAAAEPTVAALVVNVSPVRLSTPQGQAERGQISAAFGLDGEELDAAVKNFCFDPVATPIGCPLLILEGGADRLVPLGSQLGFLGANPAEQHRATVRTWPDGQHTLYNHAAERNALIAAWLADQFAAQA